LRHIAKRLRHTEQERPARAAKPERMSPSNHSLQELGGVARTGEEIPGVKGYRELEVLHRRLNPQCSCQRWQAHWVMNASLTQQEQVA
jgi:hypothetical protein